MRFRLERTGRHWTITGTGVASVLLLGAVFALPSILTPKIGPDAAAERVRTLLAWRITQRQQAELKTTGRALPDVAMAKRWQTDLERIERTQLESVRVRRPLPDYLSVRPSFVVEVQVREPHRPARTRYFWLGRTSFGRETSKLAWCLAV